MTASERNQGQDERLASRHKVEGDQQAEMAQKYGDSEEDDVPLSARKQQSAARGAANGVASDSDDEKPLAARSSAAVVRKVVTRKLESGTAVKQVVRKVAVKTESGGGNKRPLDQKAAGTDLNSAKKLKPTGPGRAPVAGKVKDEHDGDEEDQTDNLPLAQRKTVQAGKTSAGAGVKRPMNGKASTSHSSPTKKVKPSLPAKVKDEPPKVKEEPSRGKVVSPKVRGEPSSLKDAPETDDDEEDDVPLSQRMTVKKTVSVKKTTTSSGGKLATKKVLEAKKTNTKQVQKVVRKKEAAVDEKDAGGGQKWSTLHHNGVIFPPPYQQHGVKVLYDGKPVDLTDKQEEVATMFAVMKDTEYATKERFIQNFWNDWKAVLGANHVIKKFELCDFTLIYEWAQREKEKKKQMSAEEKKKVKEEKLKMEEKYMWALVDGVKEKVGNFRVEPPGLFRGRGDHPKMGKLKKRILPKDIVINISKDAPVPECPIPNSKWKEVRHDNTVTWLAYWNDPINPKEFKYVFLAPSSTLKGQSDKEKYEKSRTLKNYIEDIRKTYTKNFGSTDMTKRQIAVATYLIDRLALRAGNEKDDDEADTVGCCSLKVEHVSLVPPRSLEFDFLGKDSIRYFNTVEVEEKVYKAIGDFKKGKKEGQDLFDKLDTSKLNAHLKEIMPSLTAKVFRTYNASITLDTLLFEEESTGGTVVEKIADYQRANKEVAILCNHQRSVPKAHGAQMEKLQGKMEELESALEELLGDLEKVKKGKPLGKDKEGKPKRNVGPDALEKKIAQHRSKIDKMKLDMSIKDDLKTVALGTSKINYMDPRITVAWCKRHEVPIEKIFNRSLLGKFAWAMDVEPDFRF